MIVTWEAALGRDHLNVALALNNRAVFLVSQVRVEGNARKTLKA